MPCAWSAPVINCRPAWIAAVSSHWFAKKMIASCKAASTRNSSGVTRIANSTAVAARRSATNARRRVRIAPPMARFPDPRSSPVASAGPFIARLVERSCAAKSAAVPDQANDRLPALADRRPGVARQGIAGLRARQVLLQGPKPVLPPVRRPRSGAASWSTASARSAPAPTGSTIRPNGSPQARKRLSSVYIDTMRVISSGERRYPECRRVKRWLSVLIGLVALAGGASAGAWVMRGQIATAMMRHAYQRAFAHDPLAELPDGLHVGLCGSGSPMPDPTREGPCVAVVAGRQLFVVDAGPGSTRRLQLMRLPPAQVSAVFLTHFHS